MPDPMSKPKVVHFHKTEMNFAAFGGPPGSATIARLVGPEMSRTMGAGIATFDRCSIEWTVLYDEVIVVLEGTFRLVVGGEAHSCKPGDVIWIPENTPIKYEGEKAKVFYALHPVDWRQKHGLA
jgi:ethanolamine utilization protein EutQ